MKFPQITKAFCPMCKKHVEAKVEIAKKKPRGTMTHGERAFNRKLAGYGSFPRPNPKGREKSTRKLDLRFKCKTCSKKFTAGKGFRVKKFAIQRA